MRPFPTPDGRLGPAALLWEGDCVVDGSIHFIGWGGEVVLCGVGLVSLHLPGVAELSCG